MVRPNRRLTLIVRTSKKPPQRDKGPNCPSTLRWLNIVQHIPEQTITTSQGCWNNWGGPVAASSANEGRIFLYSFKEGRFSEDMLGYFSEKVVVGWKFYSNTVQKYYQAHFLNEWAMSTCITVNYCQKYNGNAKEAKLQNTAQLLYIEWKYVKSCSVLLIYI